MSESKIIKPHPGTEPKGEPVKAKSWKNLYFDQNGSSHLSGATYATESEAIADAARKGIRVRDNLDCVWRLPDGSLIKGKFSHCIQIPWNRG